MREKDDAGILEFAIIRAISSGNCYGMQIHSCIEGYFGRKSSMGGMYTKLHRMETKGWVKGKWGNERSGGARRRYYSITEKGKKACEEGRKVLVRILQT